MENINETEVLTENEEMEVISCNAENFNFNEMTSMCEGGDAGLRSVVWQTFETADMILCNEELESFTKDLFESSKEDIVILTELVIVLNWKIWQHYDSGNMERSRVYNDLWCMADGWCCDNLKGDAAEYFYSVTD